MRLYFVGALVISLLAESLAQTLIQPELSITRDLMKTARMHCQVEGIAFESAVIHWYRQTPKQSIRRIMYIQSKSSPQRDDGFSNRFTAENIAEGGISRLEIAQLETSDAGTYYCACWVSTVTLSNSKAIQIPSPLPPTDQIGVVLRLCFSHRFRLPNLLIKLSDFIARWRMVMLAIITSTGGCFAMILTQYPVSITKRLGKTIRIHCNRTDGEISSGLVVHWYQHKKNQPLTRLLIYNSGTVLDAGVDNRFKIEMDKKACSLIIDQITLDDSATYYCAAWEEHSTK
eukprot:gi/632965844/ref/XP_007899092.1/ PREDICTED: uncharacterized protein LOC103183432 [Callorhinchus milii]